MPDSRSLTTAAMTRGRRGAVTGSLVDLDPELTAGIPAAEIDLARRALERPCYEIPKGKWSPQLLSGHDNGAIGILLVAGAVLRQINLADRHCAWILGPGDLLQPPAAEAVVEFPISWTALQPSQVIVLDASFTRASQRWPTMGINLQRRLLNQADRIAIHAAISQLPRVESRVLALFWQLAERWGRVTPRGVEVPLELTHETIGRLAGAQRPTVTLALGALAEQGLLTRSHTANWLLAPDSQAVLRSAPPAAAAS